MNTIVFPNETFGCWDFILFISVNKPEPNSLYIHHKPKTYQTLPTKMHTITIPTLLFTLALLPLIHSTSISSHALDSVKGHPAEDLQIVLTYQHNHEWIELDSGTTNPDGRIVFNPSNPLKYGNYSVVFHVKEYFMKEGIHDFFYEQIPIQFRILEKQLGEHFHIPLLLSPFGYSTYRGS